MPPTTVLPGIPPLLPRIPPGEEQVVGSALPRYDLSYRDSFWLSRGYEDRCDRIALRGLLPAESGRLLDLGAGYGRLVDEYRGFEAVTLVDASPAMLRAANERVAGLTGVTVVGADATRLPIPDHSIDVVVAVRLLVHIAEPAAVFREVARVLRPGGTLVLEYANRRHLLSIVRFLARRQAWSPFDPDPIEYLAAHFAHQPSTIDAQLRVAGLVPDARRAVSLFRSARLKRLARAEVLASIESPLQSRLSPLALSPSIYVRAVRSAPTTIERVVSAGVKPQTPEELGCEF